MLLSAASTRADELQFVRGGLVVASSKRVRISQDRRPLQVESIPLGDARQLVLFAWQPLTRYRVLIGDNASTHRSPLAPSPYCIQRIPLEDASQVAAAGGAPDSVVRFSPDGRNLAIGTFGGWLRVVESYSGKLLHERRIAEGMVKTLAWSPDGKLLYVGEQSPDAYLLAFTAPDFEVAWKVRLADDVNTSRPPENDRYGMYTLPAVHDLKVSADGRVFAAGMHSWPIEGKSQNRSVLCCFDLKGRALWRRPARSAFPFNIPHFAIDPNGTRLLFLPSQTQRPVADATLRTDTLYLLDARTGKPAAEHRIEPLLPHFTQVAAWDSVALSNDASRAAIGLADGRALLFDASSDQLKPLRQLDLGSPVTIGVIPIVAACSYTRFFGDRLFLQTQNTHIPFGSPQAANQAPSVHHGANTLTVADLDGNPQWRYRGPFALTGSWCDRSGPAGAPRWLAVTCRELPGAVEPGQYGFLLFDLERPGGGSQKLVYHYSTEAPVIFHADISPDGRLVTVTEVPAQTPNGQDVYGTHQVHIVH